MLSSVLLDNSRLEATIDRRTFIRLVAGSAACSFVGGAVPAGAEELDDNFTPFSPELAAEMASAFFEGAGGLSNCIVVHDGWSDEAFINYDFQGFMDKNGVFM